jgi:hypothetical protein
MLSDTREIPDKICRMLSNIWEIPLGICKIPARIWDIPSKFREMRQKRTPALKTAASAALPQRVGLVIVREADLLEEDPARRAVMK